MGMVRIEVDVAVARAARAEQAAYATGVQGVEILDEEVGAPPGRFLVRLYVPSGKEAEKALGTLRAALPSARLTVSALEGETRGPRARKLGRRFVVVGEPSETPRADGRVELVLEGERAFGDGFHPTTRLAVGALESLFGARRSVRVLDVGTGTGVLALVAAELGAETIVATDVDPLARDAARRAVRRQGHRARIAVRARMPREGFDLVVANLYRELLVSMARELAARVAKGGVLVVSGFASTSAREVARVFEAEGLVMRSRASREGWGLLVLERPRPTSSRGRPSTREPARAAATANAGLRSAKRSG